MNQSKKEKAEKATITSVVDVLLCAIGYIIMGFCNVRTFPKIFKTTQNFKLIQCNTWQNVFFKKIKIFMTEFGRKSVRIVMDSITKFVKIFPLSNLKTILTETCPLKIRSNNFFDGYFDRLLSKFWRNSSKTSITN